MKTCPEPSAYSYAKEDSQVRAQGTVTFLVDSGDCGRGTGHCQGGGRALGLGFDFFPLLLLFCSFFLNYFGCTGSSLRLEGVLWLWCGRASLVAEHGLWSLQAQ